MGQAQSKEARGNTYLAILSLQVGLQPLLQKSFAQDVRISRVSLVLACECAKLVASALLLSSTGGWGEATQQWSFKSMIAAAGTPAVIYALQNVCIQTAYQKLSMVIFNLLNQSKIIFTALFLYALAGKKQTPQQLMALVMLSAAAVMLSSKEAESKGKKAERQTKMLSGSGLGVACVLTASALSGLATSLSQVTLQNQGRNSFLYSMELAVISMTTLLGSSVISGNTDQLHLRGWRASTLLPVMTQGCGGILIGQVTKNLGAVEKCFATVIGILITGLAQKMVFGRPFDSKRQRFSALLVIASVLLHAKGGESPTRTLLKRK